MNIPYSPKSLTLKFTYYPDDDQMFKRIQPKYLLTNNFFIPEETSRRKLIMNILLCKFPFH